ncbi:MAG: hypothetical protein ACRETQ_00775, partial [Gammaproteobacteria bacterium]
YGYAYSPVGFPANFQIGIASAADGGLPNAQAAWTVFQNRGMQPAPPEYGYNDDPNFAVLPRTLPYTPIVSVYASPNPVASGATTTLYWNASDATSCSATWTSSTAASGQVTTGAITTATSYPITCTGTNGSTAASVNVTIATAAPPPTTTTPPPPAPAPPTGKAPPPATPAKSGGGALGWPGLLVLAVLTGFATNRRRRCK